MNGSRLDDMENSNSEIFKSIEMEKIVHFNDWIMAEQGYLKSMKLRRWNILISVPQTSMTISAPNIALSSFVN